MWRSKQTAKKARGTTVEWKNEDVKQSAVDLHRAAAQAKRKPDIAWKDAPQGSSCARQVFPERYREPPNLDPRVAERFIVGVPVMAACALAPARQRGVYQFVPLEPFEGDESEAPVPIGSLLVYAGPVYEMERFRGQRDVAAIKHTFIPPMGRCIIHDFNLIKLL